VTVTLLVVALGVVVVKQVGVAIGNSLWQYVFAAGSLDSGSHCLKGEAEQIEAATFSSGTAMSGLASTAVAAMVTVKYFNILDLCIHRRSDWKKCIRE